MAMDRGKGHHMILSAAHLSNAVLTQRAISGPCETQRLESRGGCWDGPRCKDQDPELGSTWRTKTLTADAQYTGGPQIAATKDDQFPSDLFSLPRDLTDCSPLWDHTLPPAHLQVEGTNRQRERRRPKTACTGRLRLQTGPYRYCDSTAEPFER